MVVRVLVVCDQPFWGGEIATRNIMKYIDAEFECDRAFGNNALKNNQRVFGNDGLKNIQQRDYDLIYIHCIWEDLLELWANQIKRLREKNPRMRIIGGIRGEKGFEGNKKYLHLLDGVNTNNLGLFERIKEIRSDVVLCHTAADTELFHPMEIDRDPEFTVLWAGDIGKAVKNWETIPSLGFKYKIATKPDFVHMDPMAEYYEYKNMPQFYNSGDVLVLPSLSEGCPQTPLEAMACGLPVLAFRTAGAVVEYLDDYQLVDNIDDMRQKLQELSNNKELRDELGRKNRRKILDNWSWSVKIMQYNDWFKSVVERTWEVWHGEDSRGGGSYLDKWGDPRDPSKWGPGKEYRIKKAVCLKMGTSALDVGCGIGHLYHLLKDTVTYTGVDNSSDQIKVAKVVFPEATFKKADIYNLHDSVGMADTVYCLSVLIHLPDLFKPLTELWSRAKKCLVFNVPTIPLKPIDRLKVQLLRKNLIYFNRVHVDPRNPTIIFNRYTKEYVLDICNKMADVERIDVYEGYINSEDEVGLKGLGLLYVRMVKSQRAVKKEVENSILDTMGEKYDLGAYFSRRDYYEKAEFKWFMSWIRDKPKDARILDCCCGTGLLAAHLGKYGYTEYYGLDKNPICVQAGTDLFEQLGLGGKIIQGDVHDLSIHYKGLFDIVTMFDVVYFSGIDFRKVVEEVLKTLKPGGWFVFDFAEQKRIPSEVNLYSKGEMKNIIGGFGEILFSKMEGNKTRWMVVARK